MAEKFTFLFYPVDGVGHFNACIGIASVLRDRGHSVVFAAPMSWRGKLKSQGFREELYQISDEPVNEEASGAKWGQKVAHVAPFLSKPPEQMHENFYLPVFQELFKEIKYCHGQIKEIMDRVKPNVVIADNFLHIPALYDQGIPWILSISITPLSISEINVPPSYAGYPTEGDSVLYQAIRKKRNDCYKDYAKEYSKWVVENGGPEVEFNFPFQQKWSPYANIYMYPTELDYTSYRPIPPNFHQFEAFVRITEETFEIPEELKTGRGKLIYFSMGTIGCAEVGIMKRLIGILAKSPNRFIVSKGPLGDSLELASNMWGANHVPQTKVIPLVDLVITHGGNNTITESFYFGKRVLVLPLLFDQPDNGQRIHETGLGLSFHPYKVTEEELLGAIEQLLADELLERRMNSISKRIQATNSQGRAADLMENIAMKNKK